jgi:hypothetical protein
MEANPTLCGKRLINALLDCQSAGSLFPAAPKMTDYRLLYGYIGLALGFGVTAMFIIIFTRGRLGYQHYRPESQA